MILTREINEVANEIVALLRATPPNRVLPERFPEWLQQHQARMRYFRGGRILVIVPADQAASLMHLLEKNLFTNVSVFAAITRNGFGFVELSGD
jgi:hypothetical protein